MALDGTESGTADHETIATDGDEAGITTSEAGNEDTKESGTATGDDQDDGKVTTDGTLAGVHETHDAGGDGGATLLRMLSQRLSVASPLA
jgi:hypothetical protein